MMGHKMCSNGTIWKIIPKLSLLLLLIWSTVSGINIDLTLSDMMSKLLIDNKYIGTKHWLYICLCKAESGPSVFGSSLIYLC